MNNELMMTGTGAYASYPVLIPLSGKAGVGGINVEPRLICQLRFYGPPTSRRENCSGLANSDRDGDISKSDSKE
jgi:hypothetical protein